MILLSIEEGVPLSSLLDEWAMDETGNQALRVYRLAKLLAADTPLADAVEEVHGVLGDEDILAIRFGTQSGTLAASIRERLEEPWPESARIAPRLRKLVAYVCVLVLVASVIITFLQIKIVPMFIKIIEEFSVPEPAALGAARRFAEVVVNYWFLFALAAVALSWLAFASWPGRQLRSVVFRRLFSPLREMHAADVLEKLSVAIRAGRPITGAVSTLARYHFDPTLRHQLLYIRNEMEQGADVWQSMESIGLLSPPEANALATADRVGNRPWVLKQLATVKKRRTMRRLTRLSELALPIIVLVVGAFVLWHALAVFVPLLQIVNSLL
jgi:type II secretory pathway component PulF